MDYYDSYTYTYNSPVDSMLTGILAIYLIVLAVWFIFYVISYIFKGIGMYTIAKRQGMDYPWLAFIPFARTYLHGELGGSITLKSKTIKNPGIWLLAMPFIFGVVNFIFYMIVWIVGLGAFSSLYSSALYSHGGGTSSHISSGMIMGIIIIAIIWVIAAIVYSAFYKVLSVLVNHQILEKFTSKNMSIAHAVLCMVVPLYESICLFAMRNRNFNPGMEPDLGRPFIQPGYPTMPPAGSMPGPYTAVPAPQEAVQEEPAAPETTAPPTTPDMSTPPVPPVPPVPSVTPEAPVSEPKSPVSEEEPDRAPEPSVIILPYTESKTEEKVSGPETDVETQKPPQGTQTYEEYTEKKENSDL